MESIKDKIKINYTFATYVKKVEESKTREGFWVQLEGSMESLLFLGEAPPFAVGDELKVTFEKVDR